MATALPFIVAGASVVSTLSALSNRQKSSSSDIPEPSTPTVAPTEDSEAVLAAKRRALLAQQSRSGRASTVLTNTDDKETFGGN